MTEIATQAFMPTQEMPINLTEPCVGKLRELIAEEGVDYQGGLRVSVAGGGCSGFSYQFALEDCANEDDLLMDRNGVKVFVDSMSLMYLTGAMLSYKDNSTPKKILLH